MTPIVQKVCSECSGEYKGYAHAKHAWCPDCYHKLYQRTYKKRIVTPERQAAERARSAKRRADPTFAARFQEIKRKCRTGFTPALVHALRRAQGGKCAICSRVLNTSNRKGLDGEHADHCHTTGAPRGLLCCVCNRTLGYYEKHQRRFGLRLGAYERYLRNPPARGVL